MTIELTVALTDGFYLAKQHRACSAHCGDDGHDRGEEAVGAVVDTAALVAAVEVGEAN